MFSSKNNYVLKTLLLISILLVGCSASKPVPIVQVVEAPKNEERPDWIYNDVSNEDGQLSFVGLSNVHLSEKNARNDARRDATNNVMQYLGTMATFKFEELSVSYGLSSEIVDPTESSQKFQKQIADNVARRLKTKKWHMEREKIKGELGYKYFVLAVIPNSVIENSFKKSLDKNIEEQQKELKSAATEKAKTQAEQAIEMFRKAKKEGLMN